MPCAFSCAGGPDITTQTFIVGTSDSPPGTIEFEFGLSPAQSITTALLKPLETGTAIGFFAYVGLNTHATIRRCSFLTVANARSATNPFSAGPELTDAWESFESAIVIEAGGLTLTIPGPNYSGNVSDDTVEPYSWEPPAAVQAKLKPFITAYEALTTTQKRATTVTLRDRFPGPADLNATASSVGASAGALVPTATLTAAPPPLLLGDFDQAGLDVDVLGIFFATAPPNIYADSNRGGSQTLEAGEFGIGTGETVISRVIIAPSKGTIILNDNDVPESLLMSTHFGASNTDSEWTLTLQTLDGVASTNALGAMGGNFSQWRMPASTLALITAIGAGDRVILAIAKASSVVDMAATAELAGASTGVLGATATLKTPAVLQATAALAGESAGALVATASLKTPVVLRATTTLAGESVGALGATAELETNAVLRATAGLAGAAAGALVVAASLQSLDVLQATAALAGKVTGSATATASLVSPDVLQATGAMSGQASGDVTASATASEALLLTAFPTTGLDIDTLGLFVAFAKPSVYLSNRPQALESGEFGLGASETLLTHIRVLANGSEIRLNDANLPSELVLSAHFGSSGTTSEWTLYIQTLDGTASTSALGSVGGNFVNFSMGNDGAAIANAIGAGDRVILAIAKASAIPPLVATGALAGAATGELATTTASLLTPATINATTEFAGKSTGKLSGTASLASLDVLQPNAAFAGAAAGELAGTASLFTPAALNATAPMAGTSAGELTDTASLLTPDILDANTALAGASAGDLEGTASLLTPVVLQPTAEFAGASAGALLANATMRERDSIDVLHPTASLSGASAGELVATVELQSLDVWYATAEFAGAAAGALADTPASLLTLAVWNATASMSGTAQGRIQTAALLSRATPVTRLSAAALNRINAFGLHGHTPLTCIEIYHPDIPENIRVVNDSDDLYIGVDRYLRAAFSATIPQDKEGELPRGELHIDNVGRAMVEWIELSQGGRGAKISIREVFIPVATNRIAEVSWEITGLDVGRIRMTNERVTVELTDNRSAKAPAVKLRHDVIESPGLQ